MGKYLKVIVGLLLVLITQFGFAQDGVRLERFDIGPGRASTGWPASVAEFLSGPTLVTFDVVVPPGKAHAILPYELDLKLKRYDLAFARSASKSECVGTSSPFKETIREFEVEYRAEPTVYGCFGTVFILNFRFRTLEVREYYLNPYRMSEAFNIKGSVVFR